MVLYPDLFLIQSIQFRPSVKTVCLIQDILKTEKDLLLIKYIFLMMVGPDL